MRCPSFFLGALDRTSLARLFFFGIFVFALHSFYEAKDATLTINFLLFVWLSLFSGGFILSFLSGVKTVFFNRGGKSVFFPDPERGCTRISNEESVDRSSFFSSCDHPWVFLPFPAEVLSHGADKLIDHIFPCHGRLPFVTTISPLSEGVHALCRSCPFRRAGFYVELSLLSPDTLSAYLLTLLADVLELSWTLRTNMELGICSFCLTKKRNPVQTLS